MQKVYFGSSEKMTQVADKSVNLIVTSPPYWQLKDYGHENQIGFDDSYEAYLDRLDVVWKESFRVLEEWSRMIINIWDQFTRASVYGRYKIVPIHADVITRCEKMGFDFLGQIIWQKTTSMNSTGWAAVMGSFPFPRNGIIKLDFEYIMIFKKLGKSKNPTKENKEKSRMTNEEWNKYFVGHWNFAWAKQGEGHIAVYPEELPKRIIKMFSFVGDTVLDPFLGSWTTLKVAKELWRNGIGYEINTDFREIISKKIGEESVDFEIVPKKSSSLEQEKIQADFSIKVEYLDKKIDPRILKFWNKITLNDFEYANR